MVAVGAVERRRRRRRSRRRAGRLRATALPGRPGRRRAPPRGPRRGARAGAAAGMTFETSQLCSAWTRSSRQMSGGWGAGWRWRSCSSERDLAHARSFASVVGFDRLGWLLYEMTGRLHAYPARSPGALRALSPTQGIAGPRADEIMEATKKGGCCVPDTDPTGRTPGQYARATVRRLRMRTLVALGVLATATALLGRAFGLHDLRFLAAEVALLVSMFVISRYVLPLVERRDRGALAEEHVGGLLDELPREGWRVIHDASLGTRQRRSHRDRPSGGLHDRDEEPPGPGAGGPHPRGDAGAGAGPGQGDRLGDGLRGRAADRLQPRLGRPAGSAAQGREGAAGEDAAGPPAQSPAASAGRRRSSRPTACWRRR